MTLILDWIFGKVFDFISNISWVFLVRFISPLKVTPKKIINSSVNDFHPIISIYIKNRTRKTLYNVRVAGISKNKFNIVIIANNLKKWKTVQHTSLNTNAVIAYVTEKTTGNEGWIAIIQKIDSDEIIEFQIKIDNISDVYFKVMDYSTKEIPIYERSDGVVSIPFINKHLPKI